MMKEPPEVKNSESNTSKQYHSSYEDNNPENLPIDNNISAQDTRKDDIILEALKYDPVF